MPTGVTPNMLVLVDGHPNSQAGVRIAERYARGFVALAAWDVEQHAEGAEQQTSLASEPTIAEAMRSAAQRRIPWIALRRDFAEPEALLSELLVNTARHVDDGLPGFAVFLADGEPPPFRRILAIVDRSCGPASGLLAYAAVALADDAGAEIDMLVIGEAGHDPAIHDETDMLAVSREQDLLDRAVERAGKSTANVNWIPAAEVAHPWWVVRDQLSQYDYDLVIDDLGDVSIGGRLGFGPGVEGALAPGQVGEIPMRLLTETKVPLLIVIDEIRLGMAPIALLKVGAVAAISLGMVSVTTLAAASPAITAGAARNETEPLESLIEDLETALEVDSADAARAEAAAESSRGGDTDSARTLAEAEAEAVVTPTTSSDKEAQEAAKAAEEKKGAQEPVEPKAPKGGADPSDVAKVRRAAAAKEAAFEKDKAQREKAEKAVAEAEEARAAAAEEAESALAALQAATTSYDEAAAYAAGVRADSTGIAGALPGGATPEDAALATALEQSAGERLDAAVTWGETALDTLTGAEQEVAAAEAKLAEKQADAQETKAEYQYSKEKLEVFEASLAESRQAPVSKGSYRLTARFGQSGGYWSSGIHTGLDFAGSSGTNIHAAASGTVVSAGWEGAYGNRVVIDHGDGYQTTYNHMSDLDVAVGQDVQTGDLVGDMGSTGNSTGSHLHFEVTKDGKFLDPEDWLGW